jgi:hypothetical protein
MMGPGKPEDDEDTLAFCAFSFVPLSDVRGLRVVAGLKSE